MCGWVTNLFCGNRNLQLASSAPANSMSLLEAEGKSSAGAMIRLYLYVESEETAI